MSFLSDRCIHSGVTKLLRKTYGDILQIALNLFYYAMSKRVVENIHCAETVKDGLVVHQHLGEFCTNWHKHNHGQLVYAEHGLLFLYTKNNRFLIPTKFCVWIPQLESHQSISYSSSLLIRTIHLDVSAHPNPFYQKVGIYQTTPLLEELIHYSKRWNETTDTEDTERTFYLNFKNLLPDICKEGVPLTLPAPSSDKLISIVNFLTEHFQTKHSVAVIAEQFGISERTLSRLFQKELGMGMLQFLKVLKLIKALEWFDEGISNVSEVVYRLGYESVSTFSNTFNEVLGYRPQVYLQKRKHMHA
jgi:AraC-like DNA-binding protein